MLVKSTKILLQRLNLDLIKVCEQSDIDKSSDLDLSKFRMLLTFMGYVNDHSQHDVALCDELWTALLNIRDAKQEKPEAGQSEEERTLPFSLVKVAMKAILNIFIDEIEDVPYKMEDFQKLHNAFYRFAQNR